MLSGESGEVNSFPGDPSAVPVGHQSTDPKATLISLDHKLLVGFERVRKGVS